MPTLHASLINIPMPARIAALPLTERGFPALFFAAEIDGKVDLRVADRAKWITCVKRKRCWICGDALGVHLHWPIGPMCVVNRVSSEPPSHRDCAEYAVRACPFLTRPHAKRNTGGLPEDVQDMPGVPLHRNPGVTAIWHAKDYEVFDAGNGHLIKLGDGVDVSWWAEGRTATLQEILRSLESGLPALYKLAHEQGQSAVTALNIAIQEASRWVPVAEAA